jgi:hypothetical protein
MSEVINKYLDFGGLQKYDTLIKEFIAKGNGTLADAIDALTAKIGNIDVEGSDSKTLAEIVEEIYASIAEIVEKQGSLEDKDGELEGKINEIIGDLESLEGSDAVMTLVTISNKLKALDDANVVERLSAVEKTVADLGKIEGGESLGDIVNKVNANAEAIETLKGDGEGSVKKAAADAQAAAIADAAGKYQEKGDYEAAGAAAQALIDAQTYVDGKVDGKFDEVGSAAAAQAAAEATASADATSKANAAESAAKTYADGLVKDAEGKVKFDAAGSAAQALADAKADAADLYQVKGDYEAAGAAADALDDAKEYADGLAVNYDASGSASKALEDAQAYVDGKVDGKFDEAGAAAQALADAKADAANLYQEKGDYETAGAAAQALTDAKAYVDAISHASDVKYENGFIKLYDANGDVIGNGFDASPFIVDGMIDTVDFVTDEHGNATTTLRFTFNIDSADSENNKKVIDVDFAKYVDVYKGDNTSIVLDSASKTFSVNEVAATKTKTVESIPVAGGPLAKLFEKAGINVSDIAAGSSVEDVLFSLLCKELWAQTLTFSEGTVASSIAEPSFTLDNSGKTVEVGTKCTLSEITMSAATASVSKNRTYSGFTYGYSAANDNAQDSANTSITAGIDVVAELNDGNYTMSRDYTQFNGASDDSATANADASQVKLDGAELTVSYVGSNSVKVTVGGPTASATFAAMPVYYACSNLKKTKDAVKDSEGQYKSDAKDAKKVTSGAASNSKTLTVTGARAYWTGSVKTAMTEFTSATVRAAGESEDNHLTKALGTDVPATVTATGGDAQVIIATQKEIKEVFSKNQIGANVFGNFNHHTVNIEGANGFTGISYHVYEWAPANPFDKDDILTITYK